MGTPAPDAVKRLVDLFDRERKVYQSPDYKEAQLLKAQPPHEQESLQITIEATGRQMVPRCMDFRD